MLLDCLFCWTFLLLQFIWAFRRTDFPSVNEEIMFYLICYGLVGMIAAYCAMEGLQHLTTWRDRILYIISVLLQKPILLPVLMPGTFFASHIAPRGFSHNPRFKVDGIEQTKFMMAVQEANFFYSFVMATMSTSTTIFVVYMEEIWNEDQIMLVTLSVVYTIFGFGVSVYLYGRKTFHDADEMLSKRSFKGRSESVVAM